VFTSAAANYLPKVRVLFDSLTEHHPEWRQHLLLVEDWSGPQCDALNISAEVVQPRDLDIPNWRQWSFCHDLVELCTAVKPYMLSKLLAREDCDAVLYFDPDIKLFSRLDDLLGEFSTSSILLTPHQVHPESSLEAIISQEISSLKHGIYNLGFLGVKADNEGTRFADWWRQRLYHFCRDDIPNGLFTDQRWIDLVPAMFSSVNILRSTRFNVASWNASTRELSIDDQGCVNAGGEKLGFYHFTAVDSGDHDLQILKFQNNFDAANRLVSSYLIELVGHESGSKISDWTFARFVDGSLISSSWRKWYRDVPEAKLKAADPWLSPGYFRGLSDKALARLDHTLVANEHLDNRHGMSVMKFLRFLGALVRSPKRVKNLGAVVCRIWKSEGIRGLARRFRYLMEDAS
jgi:hypothetical protein